MAGSERCGQSSWLTRGFADLTAQAERYRFAITGQEGQWEEAERVLSLGNSLPRTPGMPGIAWCLDTVQNGVGRRVYVYDIAADELTEQPRLGRHRSLRQLSGLAIVIDPFGLDLVRQRYGHVIQNLRPPVRPTPRSFGETELNLVLRSFEVCRPAPPNGVWNLSVAVIVTKLDVLGLGAQMESLAAGAGGQIHEACRVQLSEWGFANMVRALDSRFRSVRFFPTWPGASGACAPGNALRWFLS
jgi:hypothetical protein